MSADLVNNYKEAQEQINRQQSYITFLVKERNKILSIPVIGWIVRKII